MISDWTSLSLKNGDYSIDGFYFALHNTQCSLHDTAKYVFQTICVNGDGQITHLSPGVSLIYDLVHDSGMLLSELFTSRNQNLVLAKLPNSGFWRYGQFFKWNRVKMAKNGLKIVEIF